ncbi:unnamed protein product, partial [Brassica rapa]
MKGATQENQAVPGGWVLCEFDMDWSKRHDTMGAAWIVKDENGRVLEHSRRAFSDVKTVGEAKLRVWLFVSTFGDFVEAVEKPISWPALQYEASEIKRELQAFEA